MHFIFLFTNTMYAQNIKGKWLAINNFGVYSDPSIYILEILDNKIAHYDFDEILFEENYKLSGSNINIKNIRRYNFESLDLNLIKMDFYDEDGLTLVFSLKFI